MMRLSRRFTLVFLVLAVGVVGLLSSCGGEARTHLTIVASRDLGEHDYWVSCDPSEGSVRDPAALCARILSEPRLVTAKAGADHSCPSGTPGVHIKGVFEGKRVNSIMSECQYGVEGYAIEWARLLDF